jgi:hypothetical protein
MATGRPQVDRVISAPEFVVSTLYSEQSGRPLGRSRSEISLGDLALSSQERGRRPRPISGICYCGAECSMLPVLHQDHQCWRAPVTRTLLRAHADIMLAHTQPSTDARCRISARHSTARARTCAHTTWAGPPTAHRSRARVRAPCPPPPRVQCGARGAYQG